MRRKSSEPTTQLGLEGLTKLESSWWECKGVFSTNYLRGHVLGMSEYLPSVEECQGLYEKIRTRWLERLDGLVHQNEAYTRSKFLDETLVDLGWSYIPEQSLPQGKTRKKPDYCLFLDEDTERQVAASEALDIFRASATVLEAKKVQHSLDQVSDVETPGWFPSQQIQDYLRWAKDDSGRFFDWAILTNGNEWRLYCEHAAPDAYFAFHLADGNTFCPREDFRLFVALFRPWAFDKMDNGKCPLDAFRTEALAHQEELENNLRKRVFDVLEELAAGYYFNPDNHLSEDDLPGVYEASLIFLYRSLFVLYAESRGLLPARPLSPGYRKRYRDEYSLVRFTDRLRDRSRYDDDAFYTLYAELIKLFTLINGTNPKQNKSLNVTCYNGGLFDPARHPNIGKWTVGDKTLANVLRQLIFAQPPARGRNAQQRIATDETVDFGTLEVRQLGDIYEGLLGGRLVVQGDRLDLVDEEGRNHQEGVFYTPDWIVQYLVRETLQPLVDEIDGRPQMQEALQARVVEEKQNDCFALGVLDLNILDPAMGSGHFLVRATEWLAEQIVYHPTTRIHTEQVVANGATRRTREEIERAGHAAVSPGVSQEQAEIAYWRRRVVESCIFGVDVNPDAVELAKLSLWLTCIAVDEPLSFLDHHLRVGDSLIYAHPEEVHRLVDDMGDEEQLTVNIGDSLTQTLRDAINTEHDITGKVSNRMEVVKQKGEQWKAARARVLRFEDVLHLWISALEGLEVDGRPLHAYEYHHLALLLVNPEDLKPAERTRADELVAILGDQIATRKETLKPFFWRLEFPSVFYSEDGSLKPASQCGFDAVLGNPPYISTHTGSNAEWRDVLTKRAGFIEDLYVHFTHLGLEILRTGGMFGFIVSDTFFTLDSKHRMRVWLQDNQLTHLGQCDPFKATVDAAMFVVRKGKGSEDDRCLFVQARYDTKDSKPERELTKLPPVGSIRFDGVTGTPSALHGALGCLRLHLVPVGIYRNACKRAFFEPRPAVLTLYSRFNEGLSDLVDEWWTRIETSRKFAENSDAIARYQAGLVPGAVTLVGLVAEGGQGMATANNGRFIGYLQDTPQAKDIEAKRKCWTQSWLDDADIGLAFRQLLTQNGGDVDAPTADNAAWEACVEPLKEEFGAQRLGLRRMDLYRIVPNSLVAGQEDFDYAWQRRKAELLSLWKADKRLIPFWSQLRPESELDAQSILSRDDVSDEVFCRLCQALMGYVDMQRLKPGKAARLPQDILGLRSSENYRDPADCARIATIYNGLKGRAQWVPFRKGDTEGNRWIDNDFLYIDWRSGNVAWLFANSGKKGAGMPVIRNPHLYMTQGVAWTRVANHVAMKARYQDACIFDSDSVRLTAMPGVLDPLAFLALLNSDIVSFLKMRFIKNTEKYEIGDVRMLPVVIPSSGQEQRLSALAEKAIQAKALCFSQDNPPNDLVEYARKLAGELVAKAPIYLHPSAQLRLLETAADCLAVIELAVNWEAEKLYGVEGLGPFDEF